MSLSPGGSPAAKSLNEVRPVAWMLVAVRVPRVGDVHAPPLNFCTMKLAGLAPASTSEATKLSVAL